MHHTKRTSAAFAGSSVVAALFMKGMPLHPLFFPWGQISLVVWALSFATVSFDFVVLVGDWSLRRKLDDIN